MNVFYWRIKLKACFIDQTNKPKTEEDIFRKLTGELWAPEKGTKILKHL